MAFNESFVTKETNDKQKLKKFDIEQIEKNILTEEDDLKDSIIAQSQDQLDSQPIEKLKD